jgi:hypothetical protein
MDGPRKNRRSIRRRTQIKYAAARLRFETADECPCLRLCPLKDVRDALGVPLPAPRRGDASRIKRLCYLSERACARLLCFADDWQHVGSVSISFGLDRLHSALACCMKPWVVGKRLHHVLNVQQRNQYETVGTRYGRSSIISPRPFAAGRRRVTLEVPADPSKPSLDLVRLITGPNSGSGHPFKRFR